MFAILEGQIHIFCLSFYLKPSHLNFVVFFVRKLNKCLQQERKGENESSNFIVRKFDKDLQQERKIENEEKETVCGITESFAYSLLKQY